MSKWLLRDRQTTVDLNGAVFLIAALLIHTVGAQTAVVLPGFVQGLIQDGGFSAKQAGFIASAETSGMAFTTVLLMFLVTKISWRWICLVSLLFVIGGNLASIVTRDFVTFCALRCLAGIGAGALIALTYGAIGMTDRPDRNFGICIMFVLTYGALAFLVMPSLHSTIGLAGILVFFAALGIVALPFVRFMPDAGETFHEPLAPLAANIGGRQKGLALAAVLLFFIANFAVWSFFFRIGVAAGIPSARASHALAVSQFFGIAGAFTTAFLGARLGRIVPIAIGILVSMGCIASLVGPIGATTFGIVAAVYVYVWNMTHPFLFAAMASFDRRGKMVVYGVAMEYLGISLGPACAALVITGGNYTNVVWLGIILFASSLSLALPPLFAEAHGKRNTASQRSVETLPPT